MVGLVQILIPLLLIIEASSGIHILDLLKNYGLSNSYGIRTQQLPRFNKYDFIVIGSGPGGSTVAGRLSENKNFRVLLLEAGKPEGILNQIPGISHLNSEYDWQYLSAPQEKACLGLIDRRCSYNKGRSLGGTSTINSLVYSRGHKLDYDVWASQGNYGWSYDEVLPYFIKSESINLRDPVDKPYRGEHGPVHVQSIFHTPLAAAYVKSGQELGYNEIDYNGREQIGFSLDQVTMVNGTRCSAAKAHLQVRRSNLNIVTEARVSKILIDDNNCAHGVQFIKNNRTYQISAQKEVILSAGAIDTPKLLMLSGIGPKDHLEELGIKVVKDAKVGYRLADHVAFAGLSFVVNQSVSLLTKNVRTPNYALQYAIEGTGPYMKASANEALAFIRSKYAVDARPDMELVFRGGSFNIDDDERARKSRRISQKIYDAVWKPLLGQDVWTIWPSVQLTRSKGRISLRSTDIQDPPIIDPKLLHDNTDVEILLEGIKLSLEIAKSKAFQQYGSRLHDIKIPGCESLGFATDDYWRCAIRHVTTTFNHDMGTAKMGPSTDTEAVVDPELRVHGVKGLRVIDASVMPDIPVGHLMATIYMIAEKGADMIKKLWTN